jgi:DNA-directed RNA polymerase-5 subunit 1
MQHLALSYLLRFCNENQLKSNKEYGDGLYAIMALVRTDQEKARYTFLDDVDYLVEDNAMDDICLSPELDGASEMPHLNITANIDTTKKSDFKKDDPTMNSSWEQNARA